MPTVTEVINHALRMIGGQRITDVTDGSKNANAASDIYELVRDELLASHPWNFAGERVELARSATAPAFGFQYKYALPADWLRTISVHDNDAGVGTLYHKEEGGFIFADSENVYMRYVKRVTDANAMTADFRRAWSSALARDLAVPVANSNTLQEKMEKQATRDKARAQSTDALAGTPDARPLGSWVHRRFGARIGWPS